MNLLIFFISFCVILEITCYAVAGMHHFCEDNVANKDFIAGVVEFEPVPFNSSLSAIDYMLQNVVKIQKLIETEGQNVDILVLPEYSLTSTAILNLDFVQRNRFAQEVPKHEMKPCSAPKIFRSLLEHLSCLAFTYKVYFVVNLLTRHFENCGNAKEVCIFNTALAFDRQGQIIAQYHKYNIYESGIDQPQFATPVVFDTDFGARLGLLICFDINYEQPAQALLNQGVDGIIFQAAWTDELPFLTAPQYHFGWAIANNITLISAGLHDPSSGSMGSGIYNGHLQIIENLSYDPSSGSKIIKSKTSIIEPAKPQNLENSFHLFEDLTNYSKKPLIDGKTYISHQDLQCKIQCKIENGTAKNYLAVAYSGFRTFNNGRFREKVQVCGLVPENLRQSFTKTSFAKLHISGHFKENSSVMPVALDSNLYPLTSGFNYTKNDHFYEFQTTEPKMIYSFALYSRLY